MGLFSRLADALIFWRRPIKRRVGDELPEPWKGRQYLGSDDLDDVPNSAETWEEAFNRPVTDKLLFRIEYADRDGVITERTIEPKSIHLITNSPDFYIRAVCHLRHEVRTFYTPRIRKCVNLNTNRPLKDLGATCGGHIEQMTQPTGREHLGLAMLARTLMPTERRQTIISGRSKVNFVEEFARIGEGRALTFTRGTLDARCECWTAGFRCVCRGGQRQSRTAVIGIERAVQRRSDWDGGRCTIE
jgi:hypothetical protein